MRFFVFITIPIFFFVFFDTAGEIIPYEAGSAF